MKNEKEKHTRLNNLSYLLISFHMGIATFSDIAVQYYLKDTLHLQPGAYSRILSVTYIPWMLKPLFGLLSDLCPIFGYRRKVYIMLCGLIDILCWIIMAYYVHDLATATLVLFLVNTTLAFSTVIGEAIVVEVSRDSHADEKEASSNAKDNISSFFIIKNIGVLGSSYLKGYLVDVISIRSIFLLASVTPVLMVISGIILHEDRQRSKDVLGESQAPAPAERILYKEFFDFIFQKQILLPLVFVILLMCTPAYDDPLFYFMTEELKFNGNILGLMSFASASTAILAIFIYQRWLKEVSFGKIMTIGNLLYSLFGFSALLLVTRQNHALGIPDHLLAIFSSSAANMMSEFILMPILSLAAVLCPKDLEATVYSVFMSCLNFGGIVSYVSSSMITDHLGITSTNFTNLPKLIIISNCTSMLPLILLIFIDHRYFNNLSFKKREDVIPMDGDKVEGNVVPDDPEKLCLLKNEV
jgi:hypothetical protein